MYKFSQGPEHKTKIVFLGMLRRIQGNLPLGISQLVTTPTVSLNRARRILQDQWRHTIRSRSVVIRNDVAELQIFRGVGNNGVDFSIAKHTKAFFTENLALP